MGRSLVVIFKPIKLQYAGINNDTIISNMSCHTDHAYCTTSTTIIEDFLRELRGNAFVTSRIRIILRNVVRNLIIICFNNLKYAKKKN